ncbi:hypothetical protein D9613_004277 [Agrocybe pediades]|uniref:Pyridoxamine 5'-phosphate oxidase Alr4036 family FMN-binding domain-containing protein n=1 Tax=Agrocybe pediades TaxID=84607 RepID=A0A8H4VJM5_9AGAR|nr:hypothetical protein D9613_004277 [Agrocybe pediades]
MASSISSKAPRWKTALEDALSKYKNQTVVQIATLDSQSTQITPRVRSHIFRHFLTSLTSPSLPLLISSTDIRTPKVHQLTHTSPHAELAWWIDGTQQQFRLRSRVFLVPHAKHPVYTTFQNALDAADAGDAENPTPALALFKNEDWEKRRVELFKSMSAHMKASWCRPTPGSILEGGEDEAKTWPERIDEPSDPSSPDYETQKRNWEFALSNFAIVVIEPYEVDFVDLKVIPNRRWLFRRVKKQDDWVWEETELVP